MLVTLNNGKTVQISFEDFDKKTDTEWKIFMDSEYGEEINDPFFDSQIEGRHKFSNSDDDLDLSD